MTVQEQRELELFNIWFEESGIDDEDGNKLFTEEAWFARAKLDKDRPNWDTAPEWAKYLTQDSNGRWAWWENRPTLNNLGKILDEELYYFEVNSGEFKYIGQSNLSKEIYEKENL